MTNETTPGTWHVFPEGVLPEGLIAGWRALLGLPPGAIQNLWHLIHAVLEAPDSPEHAQLIENYSQRFGANPAQVLGAVRACAFLLRQAAALHVAPEAFEADLIALSPGGARAGAALLMSRYVEVRDGLRGRLLEDTLADHGKVLVGFDWRIDRIQLSNHGQMEEAPVVFLNLRYREGEKQRQLALQLPPNAVASLKAFWERFDTEK